MPKQEQRYIEYLSSYHFFPNSIDFRIVSSKALEKFKNVQSFQLNQLVNGHFYFQQDRREILLLKYDMYSRWLTEVENLFIELHETSSTVRQKDIDVVVNLVNKTAEKYVSIIKKEHSSHFHDDFSNIWLEVHALAHKYLVQEIKSFNGTYEYVFSMIVDLICEALQYTLSEIHELNEIFKGVLLCDKGDEQEAFLVYTKFCRRFYDCTDDCLLTARAKIHKKYFNLKNVWFKNYTDEPIPSCVISGIEDLGLSVDFKRCIFR